MYIYKKHHLQSNNLSNLKEIYTLPRRNYNKDNTKHIQQSNHHNKAHPTSKED